MTDPDTPTPLQAIASVVFHEVCDNAEDSATPTLSVENDVALITSYNSEVQVSLVPTLTAEGTLIKTTYGYNGKLGGTIWFNYLVELDDMAMVIADLLYSDDT